MGLVIIVKYAVAGRSLMDSTMFEPPVQPEPKTLKNLVAQVNDLMKSQAGKNQVLTALALLLLD